jgi:hypothetical protein
VERFIVVDSSPLMVPSVLIHHGGAPPAPRHGRQCLGAVPPFPRFFDQVIALIHQ